MNARAAIASLSVLLSILASAPALAESEWLGGWEGDAVRGYAFVGPAQSFAMADGRAVVLRGAASYLYYSFPEAGGVRQVKSPGAQLELDARIQLGHATLAAGPGVEIRHEESMPAIGSTSRVWKAGPTAAFNAYVPVQPLTVGTLIASYGAASRYVWTRAGIKQQITDRHFDQPVALALGVEGTGQGNSDARSYQVGGVLELAFPRASASLQIRAGFSRLDYPDAPGESEGYVGLGFYRAFMDHSHE